jgi:hypothetical protein
VRKFVSFLLFSVIIWQIIGFVGYFELSHYQIKKEIKSLLKKGVPKDSLTSFKFSEHQMAKLNWLKKNEFKFKGRLYDVVYKVKDKDGFSILNCISDTQEEVLFAKLGQTVANSLGEDQPHNPIAHWFKLNKQYYCFQINTFLPVIYVEAGKTKSVFAYMNFFQSVKSNLDTPPPNIS